MLFCDCSGLFTNHTDPLFPFLWHILPQLTVTSYHKFYYISENLYYTPTFNPYLGNVGFGEWFRAQNVNVAHCLHIIIIIKNELKKQTASPSYKLCHVLKSDPHA